MASLSEWSCPSRWSVQEMVAHLKCHSYCFHAKYFVQVKVYLAGEQRQEKQFRCLRLLLHRARATCSDFYERVRCCNWFEDGSDVDLVGLGELRVVRGNVQGIEGDSCCIYKVWGEKYITVGKQLAGAWRIRKQQNRAEQQLTDHHAFLRSASCSSFHTGWWRGLQDWLDAGQGEAQTFLQNIFLPTVNG